MPYMETKVYFDGSHYVGIPHTTKPYKPRRKKAEEVIQVEENVGLGEKSTEISKEETTVNKDMGGSNATARIENMEQETPFNADMDTPKASKIRSMTKKQLFEELYAENIHLKKGARKNVILRKMLPYFTTKSQTESYVKAQFERKQRNLICRRIRLTRKVNLQEFNYFCTFTYDSAKHTEESFKKKLRDTFKKMCYRRKWKYAGVWEYGKEGRLHFHGLFYIPEGQMVGEIIMVKDYSIPKHKMQERPQNTYFNERFGRSDFEEIDNADTLGRAVGYMMKYIGKTGEKIVYSKGLPQFFISDILDEDVICMTGAEDNKLVLFDDFLCIDEGVVIGKVSKETISKMRKVN